MKSKSEENKKESKRSYSSLAKGEKEKLLMYNSKKGDLWKIPALMVVVGIMVLGVAGYFMFTDSPAIKEHGDTLVMDATISDISYAIESNLYRAFFSGFLFILGAAEIGIGIGLYIVLRRRLMKKIGVTNEVLMTIDI